MDKAGHFIGWPHIEGVNLSVSRVESALSKVPFTGERSSYYKTLLSGEGAACSRKEKGRGGGGLDLCRSCYSRARDLTQRLGGSMLTYYAALP